MKRSKTMRISIYIGMFLFALSNRSYSQVYIFEVSKGKYSKYTHTHDEGKTSIYIYQDGKYEIEIINTGHRVLLNVGTWSFSKEIDSMFFFTSSELLIEPIFAARPRGYSQKSAKYIPLDLQRFCITEGNLQKIILPKVQQ